MAVAPMNPSKGRHLVFTSHLGTKRRSLSGLAQGSGDDRSSTSVQLRPWAKMHAIRKEA
jgi:hypothetical protein